MPDHSTPLIATIVVGLALAFAFGLLAQRLRISPLVGYLLAGVVVGPFTPGFVADAALAGELAEIGVILLMFGSGCISPGATCCRCGAIAVPGAIVQIAWPRCWAWGWRCCWAGAWCAGLVFGLALSVASTVVLVRALQERRLMERSAGASRSAGWWSRTWRWCSPWCCCPRWRGATHGGPGGGAGEPRWSRSGVTLGKVALFGAVMLVVGRRAIPWLLHYVAHTGSRELFRLAVYAIALGVAFGAAKLFGVSLRAGRLLRRHGAEREQAVAARGRGSAAAARCLRGAVLRLGRHAVRPAACCCATRSA